MTENILMSLYIKNMFIYMDEKAIVESLKTKEDKIKFIDGILYLFNNSLLFNVNAIFRLRLVTIIRTLQDSEEWDKEFSKVFESILNTCKEYENQKSDDTEYNTICYGNIESRNRGIKGNVWCTVSPSEIEQYFYSDYMVIKGLVENKKIDETFNIDEILSALGLLLSSYYALLFENPKIESVISEYLNRFDTTSVKANTVNRRTTLRVKKLLLQLDNYKNTKDMAYEVNRVLFDDGYYLVKDREIKKN